LSTRSASVVGTAATHRNATVHSRRRHRRYGLVVVVVVVVVVVCVASPIESSDICDI
jgi:t-SNARE complex subunit (syntaxin)